MSLAVKATIVATAFLLGFVTSTVVRGDSTPDAAEAQAEAEQPADTQRELGEAGGGPEPKSAVEAGVEYATASQDWLYLTDEQIDAAVREIASPSVADRLSEETVSELSVAREALKSSAGPVWWFVRPLAVHAEVGETRAEVSVWVVTVLSAADVAVPQADWMTLDLTLVRDGDRWLLESITDTPGPTPMSGVRDEPWQPEPFDEALLGFERVGIEP